MTKSITNSPANIFLSNQHIIDVNTIPVFSPATKLALQNFGQSSRIHSQLSLKRKAVTLVEITKKLEQAKKHEKKDKIFAVFRTALGIALIAGVVLGTATAGIFPAGIGIALGSLGAYILLTLYNMSRPGIPQSSLGLGKITPFLPLCEAFTKIGRLKLEFRNLTSEASKDFEGLKNFFKKNGQQLSQMHNEKIADIQSSLDGIEAEQLQTRSEQNKRELSIEVLKTDLLASKKALKEITEAIHFFESYKEEEIAI